MTSRQCPIQLLSVVPLANITENLKIILEVLLIHSTEKPPLFKICFLSYLRPGCLDCSQVGLPRGSPVLSPFLPWALWFICSQQECWERPRAFLRHDFSWDTDSILEVSTWSRRMHASLVLDLLFGVGKNRGCLGSVTIEVYTCSLLSTMCFSINLLTPGDLALSW